MLHLVPMQDTAGDAWIEVWLKHRPAAAAPAAFIGMHAEAVRSCRRSPASTCWYSAAAGAAEAAGMHVSAGYAFVHGMFLTCLVPSCANPRAAEQGRSAVAAHDTERRVAQDP